MISALVVAANFIKLGIEQNKPMTPMKLQKLIYLAHGIHLARFDVPLISDDVEAWSYGPVIRTVYDEFKIWGNRNITEVPESIAQQSHRDNLTEDELGTIQIAWDIAKDLTGPELSIWSHSVDSPWEKAYKSGGNRRIKREIIRDYFLNTMKIEA